MTNLVELTQWDAGIYQLETADPVMGGPDGTDNLQAKQLANRTKYLKALVDALVDGSTVPPGIATQTYVQGLLNLLDAKQSVRAATTANIALVGTQTIDGVVLQVADRVLVKNQNTPADNGLYVVSGSGWTRAGDADISTEVTPGLVVFVEEGALQGNSRWQVTTDGPLVLGTTALTFQDITLGYAALAGAAFTASPTAPTPAQFDVSTKLATMAAVQRAAGTISGGYLFNANATLTAAHVGATIEMYGAGAFTLTLPLVSAAGGLAAIRFINLSSVNQTVACQGADVFVGGIGTPTTSYVVKPGDTLEVQSFNGWVVTGGTAMLGTSGAFASSPAANGYIKLPGGLILQWGVAVTSASADVAATYPVAFTSAVYFGVTSCNSGANGFFGTFNGSTLAGGLVGSWSATGSRSIQTVVWFALGK